MITKCGFIIIPKIFVDRKLLDKLVVLRVNVLSLPLLNYPHIENTLYISLKSITKNPYMTIRNEEIIYIDTPIFIYIYDKKIIPVYITVQQKTNLECNCETHCLSVILYKLDRISKINYKELETTIKK